MRRGIKARLGHKIAELPTPWILRHDGATETADISLILFADVKNAQVDTILTPWIVNTTS